MKDSQTRYRDQVKVIKREGRRYRPQGENFPRLSRKRTLVGLIFRPGCGVQIYYYLSPDANLAHDLSRQNFIEHLRNLKLPPDDPMRIEKIEFYTLPLSLQ